MRLIFKIGSDSSPLDNFSGLSFSGVYLAGLNFVGLLLHRSGLQSDPIDALPSFNIRLTGEGELAMLKAYSRALRIGESIICSPDSLSI